MARAKKTELYRNLYGNLSLDDMKVLRTELDYAIKALQREEIKRLREEDARQLRDSLKIHDKVRFLVKKDTKEGEVVTISVDKVQVLMAGGEKKSISYQKILK